MSSNGYTPTQTRMLAVLSDGKPHKREELRACLWDEAGDRKNIRPHLSAIRKHLHLLGEDIVCVARQNTYWYQHIRLLRPVYSANDGCT